MSSHSQVDIKTSADMVDSVRSARSSLCPSAQPDWEEATVFGVVGGTEESPRVSYLVEPQAASPELLALTHPVKPTEVLRIAAPCAGHGCQHFDGTHCQLVARTIIHLEAVTEKLPACSIRPSCRWWQEQGKAACMRCPQVITDNVIFSEPLLLAATPDEPVEL
jgi:hypothetical protein